MKPCANKFTGFINRRRFRHLDGMDGDKKSNRGSWMEVKDEMSNSHFWQYFNLANW